MKIDRRNAWAVVVALASALGGCAEDDHPPVSESAPMSQPVLGGSDTSSTSSADSDETTPTAEPGPCEPRAHRDCKIYYRDESGQLNCPTNVQFCSDDGTEWLPCGAYTLDENGDLVAIH